MEKNLCYPENTTKEGSIEEAPSLILELEKALLFIKVTPDTLTGWVLYIRYSRRTNVYSWRATS